MAPSKLLLGGALALLSLPALAQEAQMRDLRVEFPGITGTGALPDPAAQVTITTDRPDATYAIGETVHLTVSASADTYLTVLSTGPGGRTTQLFPNARQGDNHVRANHPVEIGAGDSGTHLVARGPVGAELIKVIVSAGPIALLVEAQKRQNHVVFYGAAGSAAALESDLAQLAAGAAAGDSGPRFTSFLLHTVGKRLAPLPGQG